MICDVTPELLAKMDAYWRAANYRRPVVGGTYLESPTLPLFWKRLSCAGALGSVDSHGLAFLSSCSPSRGIFRVLRFSPSSRPPELQLFMSRNSLVASLGLVAGLVAGLSAQATSPNNKVNEKTIQSIRIRVIGCVAGGSEAGRYRLTHAVLSGDDTKSKAGTAGKAGSGKDVSFENSPSFDLIGGSFKAHLGHKVEVVGITSDTKLNNSDSLRSAIGSSTREQATLTVSSVKMIAATCP